MYDSLLHLSDTLLGMARKSQLETPKVGLDGMDGETVQLNVSTSVPEQQTSSRTTRQRSNQTPSPVEMPSLGVKTGHTPVDQSKTDKQFEERCRGCLGFLYCQLIPDPAVKRKGKGSDKRIRRMCYWCDSRTDYFCFGCRRYLCFGRPNYKKGEKKDTKQPRYLTVSTPDLRGRIQDQILSRTLESIHATMPPIATHGTNTRLAIVQLFFVQVETNRVIQ